MIRTIPAVLFSSLSIMACEPVELTFPVEPHIEPLASGSFILELSSPEVLGNCMGLDVREVDGAIMHALIERHQGSLFIELEGFFLEGHQEGAQILADGAIFMDTDVPVDDDTGAEELIEEGEISDAPYPEDIYLSLRGTAFSPFEFEGIMEYDVRGPGIDCSLNIPYLAFHKRGADFPEEPMNTPTGADSKSVDVEED